MKKLGARLVLIGLLMGFACPVFPGAVYRFHAPDGWIRIQGKMRESFFNMKPDPNDKTGIEKQIFKGCQLIAVDPRAFGKRPGETAEFAAVFVSHLKYDPSFGPEDKFFETMVKGMTKSRGIVQSIEFDYAGVRILRTVGDLKDSKCIFYLFRDGDFYTLVMGYSPPEKFGQYGPVFQKLIADTLGHAISDNEDPFSKSQWPVYQFGGIFSFECPLEVGIESIENGFVGFISPPGITKFKFIAGFVHTNAAEKLEDLPGKLIKKLTSGEEPCKNFQVRHTAISVSGMPGIVTEGTYDNPKGVTRKVKMLHTIKNGFTWGFFINFDPQQEALDRAAARVIRSFKWGDQAN